MAPYDQWYYSLEAIVKNNDSNTTSVKTIKVGNPTNANVRVNVKSSESGSEVLGESNRTEGSDSEKDVKAEPKVDDNGQLDVSGDYYFDKSTSKGFGQYLTSMLREIADFLWPF